MTQVDPAGMGSTSLESPQMLNLYAYCANDPINHADPSGLGFFSWLKGVFQRVIHALIHAVIAAVFTFLVTLVRTGGNFHLALVAGVAAGIADFLKELGWPSRGYGLKGTPPWNPNAGPVFGIGSGGLSRYLIYNLAQAAATVTTCEMMARVAQLMADLVINEGRRWDTVPVRRFTPSEALGVFNGFFGQHTFGFSFNGSWPHDFGARASSRGNVFGDGRNYRGQDGFALQFWDTQEMNTDNSNPDQVHHFGAYFSAGIMGESILTTLHQEDDEIQGNFGDVRLADQAWDLGVYLRNHPTKLRNVGQLIRATICQGRSVPK